MNDSDAQLLVRLAGGDQSAFREFVDRWDSRLARVLRRLTPRRGDVDDLKQEVFLRVLRSSHRFRPTGSSSAWVYQIAVNLARDAARRHRVTTELPLDVADRDRDTSPYSGSIRRERVRLVEQSVLELPEKLREVVVLKHYANLTFAELAESLAESPSTIKSRFQAALRRLEISLKRRGISHLELET